MCPDAAALAAAAAFEALFLANSSFSRALRLTASGDIPVGESEGRAKKIRICLQYFHVEIVFVVTFKEYKIKFEITVV